MSEVLSLKQLLQIAVLRGWKRGRRNQDPEQEAIAKKIMEEFPTPSTPSTPQTPKEE